MKRTTRNLSTSSYPQPRYGTKSGIGLGQKKKIVFCAAQIAPGKQIRARLIYKVENALERSPPQRFVGQLRSRCRIIKGYHLEARYCYQRTDLKSRKMQRTKGLDKHMPHSLRMAIPWNSRFHLNSIEAEFQKFQQVGWKWNGIQNSISISMVFGTYGNQSLWQKFAQD